MIGKRPKQALLFDVGNVNDIQLDGHKVDIAVDVESQIIVAVDILAGNAGDAANALSQGEQAEANTGLHVIETTGDCAYGGETCLGASWARDASGACGCRTSPGSPWTVGH